MRKIYNPIKIWISLALEIALISSCSPKPSILDIGNSCTLPCWQGIYPNATTRSDVLSFLALMDGVDRSTILESPETQTTPDIISWRFSSDLLAGIGRVYFERDVVIAINLNPLEGVTLEQAVSKLGTPEFVSATFECAPKYWVSFQLINKTRGVLIQSGIDYSNVLGRPPDNITIDPKVTVKNIYFFEPSMLKEVASMIGYINYRYAFDQIPPDALQNWIGFNTPISYIDFCQ